MSFNFKNKHSIVRFLFFEDHTVVEDYRQQLRTLNKEALSKSTV